MKPSKIAAKADIRVTRLQRTFHRYLVSALLLMGFANGSVMAQDLLISGVMDGPLTGGVPKVVEIYVINNVADLSACGVGSANNGGGTDGQEFTFPAVGASAGTFLYIATETTGFNNFFGFAPDFTSSAVGVNGDDAVELFCDGTVADVFGDIDTDGSGTGWDYLDGWAYRVNDTGPDGSTFTIANWSFSGVNALDTETSNATAATPFPLGTYSAGPVAETAPMVTSSSPAGDATGVAVDASISITFSEDVNAVADAFSISCATSGSHTFVLSGGPKTFTLNPESDFVYDELCTVTVAAAEVTDIDTDDPPDAMEADHLFNFTIEQEPVDSPLVINEIHADPASSADGDANGDGTRDSGDDEFVEIVNADAADFDISGWTLADGYTVRHTFPEGTVIAGGCSIVVFGGGEPAGSFGKSLVQTASGGSLGLNNGGDSVILNNGSSDVLTASYGGEGGDNQSLTLDPDITGNEPRVKHSEATGSGGALFSPGTKIDGSQFEGCPSVLVINEINADPDSTNGDANGDGAAHYSQDEFVEIVNTDAADFDISGWTLADGYTVRHTFPEGTVIAGGCSIVVFGGGEPAGSFGKSLVQTASGGSLGLNNGGDSVILNNGSSDVLTASYGGEGGDNQSLTLDPDITGNEPRVKHTVATGSGGALFSPGTKIDGSQFEGCPVEAEIYEIQGSDASSAIAGSKVVTANNIVTAVGPQGFFMQTPDARADASVDTSNGIYVHTGSAPTVAVGDNVDVSGDVDEYYGFTEITGSLTINVNSSGNPLPATVTLNASVPSPNPAAPSCAIEFECYEGMLVEIASGVVTSGNQRFGSDPVAEVYISAGPRAFREPGVEYPGLGGTIPTWDTNPEIFELDADKLGLPNPLIAAGSGFSATGVIGFEFGGYELWPTELSVTDAIVPVPVRARVAGETTIGSLNLFRACESGDDCAARLAKLSGYIIDVLRSPDILAVQEAMGLGTLQALADQVAIDDSAVQYMPYLIVGNDVGGINVGFLVRGDRVEIDSVMQLGAGEIFDYDGSKLHDRPPLLLEGHYTANGRDFPLAVMVVHNRSLNGIEGERVQLKRLTQAESIAAMVQSFQVANPQTPLTVVGDFNAFEFTDGYVDAVGHIKGSFNPAESLHYGADLVSPDLINQVDLLDPSQRYSFIYQGSAQALDHALTSAAAAPWVRGMAYGRGNADAATDLLNDGATLLRSSDHDGLVVFMMTDFDGDGFADDVDGCPQNQVKDEPDAESGCEVFIPTLNPAGLAMLLLLLGGLGAYTIRYRGGV